ncbi:MAG: flagellar assembly protein FliW [Bacillota bacterium]|nr:flagellar assembly protein FliW [Bacillota bacterium]
MRVLTRRFGILKVPEDLVWRWPVPLPGFPRSREYVLIDDERVRPFLWLQSLNEPEVAFVIVDTALVAPGYNPVLPEGGLACLGLEPGARPVLYAIVTVPGDPRQAWVNLRAPLALNAGTRLGRQVVLADERYSFRHPLREAVETPGHDDWGRRDSQGGRLLCWSLPASSIRASLSATRSA